MNMTTAEVLAASQYIDSVMDQYIDSVVEIGLARSAESLGYESHAFALGFTQSEFRMLLEELNLNQRQLKILSQRVL